MEAILTFLSASLTKGQGHQFWLTQMDLSGTASNTQILYLFKFCYEMHFKDPDSNSNSPKPANKLLSKSIFSYISK